MCYHNRNYYGIITELFRNYFGIITELLRNYTGPGPKPVSIPIPGPFFLTSIWPQQKSDNVGTPSGYSEPLIHRMCYGRAIRKDHKLQYRADQCTRIKVTARTSGQR